MYTVLGRNQEPKNRYQFLQESIYVDEKKKKEETGAEVELKEGLKLIELSWALRVLT